MNATRAPIIDESFLDQYRELDEPGQPTILNELIKRFLAFAPEKLDCVSKAVKSRSPMGIRHEAHALKNVAGNVGARPLADSCHRLEKKGEDGDMLGVDELYASIATEFQAVAEELRKRAPTA
jgi:HPt (histidine-containing phosphotransfer) domain-containing protein